MLYPRMIDDLTNIGCYPKIASMWIDRDFLQFLAVGPITLPIKVLKGPRQVGKTSLLDHLGAYKLVLFDDLGIRHLARENPSLFFDQFTGPLILDEATLAPEIFPELKKRVDAQRRKSRANKTPVDIDIWITGSNQTLLQRSVAESLAGRASYFSLNTLSVHELKKSSQPVGLNTLFMRGGWPELYATPDLDAGRYLNDFIATFIEKDIVSAAGIERRAAFSKMLQLVAGRVAQLLNSSDIAKTIGVDTTTVQAWLSILQQNGILRLLQPYYTNLNQRLIKTPKVYFEDIGLATRLQGWNEFEPLLLSPYFGNLLENLALSEVTKFFMNQGLEPQIYFVRSKEKVEVDLLIQLSNQRFIAAEVKTTPIDLSPVQLKLLDSLQLNIIEKWILSPDRTIDFKNARVIPIHQIYDNLERVTGRVLS